MTKKDLDFTKSYEELEKIVSDFESRDLDLEKDIKNFERGLELAQNLKKRLEEIENKVTKIEEKFTDKP